MPQVSGGPTTFLLDIPGEFTSLETCTVQVYASQVTDQDLLDPPDHMEAGLHLELLRRRRLRAATTPPFTKSRAAVQSLLSQGRSFLQWVSLSAITKDPLLTCAASTFKTSTAMGILTTSDGIFVFNGNNDSVSLGELIWVNGTAGEFQGQTQISNVTTIAVCGERQPRTRRRHLALP
jgi:uncharacterized protein